MRHPGDADSASLSFERDKDRMQLARRHLRRSSVESSANFLHRLDHLTLAQSRAVALSPAKGSDP
jgi:hypothetical protein